MKDAFHRWFYQACCESSSQAVARHLKNDQKYLRASRQSAVLFENMKNGWERIIRNGFSVLKKQRMKKAQCVRNGFINKLFGTAFICSDGWVSSDRSKCPSRPFIKAAERGPFFSPLYRQQCRWMKGTAYVHFRS